MSKLIIVTGGSTTGKSSWAHAYARLNDFYYTNHISDVIVAMKEGENVILDSPSLTPHDIEVRHFSEDEEFDQ